MKIANLSVGQQLPIRHFKASNVSLFCYNAAIWNPHRIHYDEKYTKEIEHHTRDCNRWATSRRLAKPDSTN
jgi:Uncharacterized conserved protein